MAFEIGLTISAAELIALKAKVKSEMLRRNKGGTNRRLDTIYASATYDYSDIPANGKPFKTEWFNKNLIPLQQVTTVSGYSPTTYLSGNPAKNVKGLEDAVNRYMLAKDRGTTLQSCCDTACVGLCSNTCSGTCLGDCYQNCGDTCNWGCALDCSGVCSFTCQTSCVQASGGGGGNTCTGACSGGCGGCSSMCSNGGS